MDERIYTLEILTHANTYKASKIIDFPFMMSSRSAGESFSPPSSSSPNLPLSPQSQTHIGGAPDGGSILSVPVLVVPPSPSTTEVEFELLDVLDLPALVVCIAPAFSVSTIG